MKRQKNRKPHHRGQDSGDKMSDQRDKRDGNQKFDSIDKRGKRFSNSKAVLRGAEPNPQSKFTVYVSGDCLTLDGCLDEYTDPTEVTDLHTKLKHLAQNYNGRGIVVKSETADIAMKGLKMWTEAVLAHLMNVRIHYESSQSPFVFFLSGNKPYRNGHPRSTFATPYISGKPAPIS